MIPYVLEILNNDFVHYVEKERKKSDISCAYLQTEMHRAPQAAAPSRLHIRLTLWAGEREGRRHIAMRASRVKRGYPGGWAT